jgi:hypothetical protein
MGGLAVRLTNPYLGRAGTPGSIPYQGLVIAAGSEYFRTMGKPRLHAPPPWA